MLAHSLFFYFFSAITVFSAIMVTASRNTVYSVFFLILVFVSVSILFIMIGAEFLGMIMLIVYVGAVAVLFLFVVMMLNVTEQKTKLSKKKGLINNISVSSIVGIIIFLELLVVVGGWKYKENIFSSSTLLINENISNTHQIGNVMYTDYILYFQVSGIILFLSMIGAILLTYRKREGVKKQSYINQISREPSTSVEIREVESNKGVKLDD